MSAPPDDLREEPAAPISTRRLRRNVLAIQVMSFTWMFLVLMPVIVPFFESLGLTRGEVFEVQAIFGLTVVLLEVPTGYVSDVLGRKVCLVIAGFLHGLAFTLLTFVHGFQGVVLFEVLAAFAVCLYSGTDVALLYDSLAALGEGAARRGGLGLRLFWMQAGETCAALLGGWIALVSLSHVAMWNAIVGWLPFGVALLLVDVPVGRLNAGGHLANLGLIWRVLVTESEVVRRTMLGLIAYGLSTLLAVWLFQGYWEHLDVPLAFFGYLWAAYNLTVALVGRLAHRIEARLGLRGTIVLIACLPVAGFAGMGATALGSGAVAATVGVLLGFAFQVGRGLTQVVLKDELNSRVRPELRATANSVSSLGVRLGYAALGPLIGHLIDGPGYFTALTAASAFYLVVALALALPLAARLAREAAEPDAG